MKSILCKTPLTGHVVAVLFYVLYSPPVALSQSPVMQYTANYVSASSPINSYNAFPTSPGSFSSCSSNIYSYTWSNGSNNQLKLVSFTANAKTYVISGITNVAVKLRRVDNANVTGQRDILYSETSAASASSCVTPRQLDFKAPYSDNMAEFLNNNVLNHGTDNVFTNANNGDGNNNNIERIDVIFTNGVQSSLPADAGFILCDRGNNNSHDGFRIAAILSIDGSNNPTSFGPVRICTQGNGSNNGSWGHPSIANGNRLLPAYILRKDPADTFLRVSSNVTQEIGGVFFSFASLGVVANQRIYGYCLLSPDGIANPTSAQLLNLNDASVYPTTTTEAQGGGLDLISVTSYFGTDQALASSYYQEFNGTVVNKSANLQWNLANLGDGHTITLERSINGIDFNPIHSYLFNGEVKKNYQDRPGVGLFYYRLKTKSADGTSIFSIILQLKLKTSEKKWKVFPTILKPGEKLQITDLEKNNYTIMLSNNSYSFIYKSEFTAQNGKFEFMIPQTIKSSGTYYLTLATELEKTKRTEKIIIKAN